MMGMRSMLLVCWLYVTCALSGCSIAMALSGNKEPNFDYITVGAPRNQVEAEFGHPAEVKELSEGRQEATYKFEMGNSPNPGRAAMWGYAWLTIIGILGEPIYSLIELNQGHDEETRIVYGADHRVQEIQGYTPPPISKVIIDAEESQEKYIERRRKIDSAPAGKAPNPASQQP
jgi:hypothetical protein